MTADQMQDAMVLVCYWLSIGALVCALCGTYYLIAATRLADPRDRWFVGGFAWASSCVFGKSVIWVWLLRPHTDPIATGSWQWVVLAALFLLSQGGLMASGLWVYLGLRKDLPK